MIDKDLNFQSHTKSIIKAANQKLSALIRVAPLMTDFNKKVILSFFIKGQFNHCPLLWMFSTKAVKHKINNPWKKIESITKWWDLGIQWHAIKK